MQGIEAKQRAEFERIWNLHRQRIWRLVARLAGNVDLADDLSQEVCIRAYQAFNDFRGEAGAYTWLYRIAINVVLRYRERKQHETVTLDSPGATALHTTIGTSPEAITLKEALRTALWTAMERLPEDLRTTLILQVYEGLKYHEIASVLQVPLETVKYRRHQAMLRLRTDMQADWREE